MAKRGALIVLEGCDRSGKSTQGRKLVDALIKCGRDARLMSFPDRNTRIGSLINDYLEKKCELDDHAVHLLFSANRWESVKKMKKLLGNGTTLIVDRYAFSGVAFTAAKKGFTLDWCKQPDVGLPRPDLVIYLDLSPEILSKRKDFGEERYEKPEIQQAVAQNLEALQESDWKKLDAGRSIEDLHLEIKSLTDTVIQNISGDQIGQLWISDKTSDR